MIRRSIFITNNLRRYYSMEVTPIKYGGDNNFCYLVRGAPDAPLFVVDPGDTLGILKRLSGEKVAAVLFTHRHWDHVGDIPQLIEGLNSMGMKVDMYIGAKEEVKEVNKPMCGMQDVEVVDFEHFTYGVCYVE